MKNYYYSTEEQRPEEGFSNDPKSVWREPVMTENGTLRWISLNGGVHKPYTYCPVCRWLAPDEIPHTKRGHNQFILTGKGVMPQDHPNFIAIMKFKNAKAAASEAVASEVAAQFDRPKMANDGLIRVAWVCQGCNDAFVKKKKCAKHMEKCCFGLVSKAEPKLVHVCEGCNEAFASSTEGNIYTKVCLVWNPDTVPKEIKKSEVI